MKGKVKNEERGELILGKNKRATIEYCMILTIIIEENRE